MNYNGTNETLTSTQNRKLQGANLYHLQVSHPHSAGWLTKRQTRHGHRFLKSKTKEPPKLLSSSGMRGGKLIYVNSFSAQQHASSKNRHKKTPEKLHKTLVNGIRRGI